MNRVELKQKAKESLKGNYGKYIGTYFIYALLTGGIATLLLTIFQGIGIDENVATLIVGILEIVAASLLTLGYVSFALKIARNQEVSYNELFSKTSLWFTFIAVSLLIYIFTFLWALLFIIPGIIASYKYAMTYYIVLDNPDIDPLEAIRKSKEMMNGHKFELFTLHLSFLGWAILGIFTLGILYFWLIPYIDVTIANFYDSLKESSK